MVADNQPHSVRNRDGACSIVRQSKKNRVARLSIARYELIHDSYTRADKFVFPRWQACDFSIGFRASDSQSTPERQPLRAKRRTEPCAERKSLRINRSAPVKLTQALRRITATPRRSHSNVFASGEVIDAKFNSVVEIFE